MRAANSTFVLTTEDLIDRKSIGVEKISNTKKKGKRNRTYRKVFSREDSPLIFRNFITYSVFENFSQEKYVSNEFYVRSVEFINEKSFAIWKTEKGKSFYEFPFKKGVDFYLSKNEYPDNPIK